MAAGREERAFLKLALRAWTFRGRVIAALVLLVVAKLAAVAVPVLLKRIIDTLGRPETVAAVPFLLLVGYALVRFSSTLFNELRDLVFARVSQTTVGAYMETVFGHLHALGARFHANRSTGALGRDVERGTTAIGFLLGTAFFTIVPTLVEISLVLAIMISRYAAAFTAILGVTFVVYALLTVTLTRRRVRHQRRVNELDSSAHSRLVDSLLNYDTVKFYTNEALEGSRFHSIVGDLIEAAIGNQRALTWLHIGQSAVIAAGISGVMLLAGSDVLAGTMTVGDLVLVNAYVIQVCLPLNSLGFVFREASDAMTKAERLFALLRERPEVAAEEHLPDLEVRQPSVRFERVSFGYEPNRQVLWDIDFTIAAGAVVAVVGGSGSGKSTLARLLLRFYDVWSGRIFIGNEDISRYTPASVRAAIGIVPQDTTLFNDSIAYNIRYGRPEAGMEEVKVAAATASLQELINRLPQQYDTVVGERGLKLSGGEKQRIAIARAVLKDPPILVLDEATSALDTRSERAIQGALEQLAGRRTTLIVAHRLSTVVGADEILVLEHGRIVERGRHAQLLERGGFYAQMWSLQEQERALRRSEHSAALRPVNLAALLAGAIAAVGDEADRKHIHLYTAIGTDVGQVTGDPGALQEVVWELLTYAVRISPLGGRVEVGLARVGNEMALSVTHASMPPGRPAPPADDDGDDMPEGVYGLDTGKLSQIIEEHGGRLDIEPAGSAVRYTASLPVAAVAAPAQAEGPGAAGHADRFSLSPRHILIVDDDEAAREVFTELLRSYGARTTAFGDGRSALDYLRMQPPESWPDLVIADIGLPDIDGYTLLRQVRALESEHRTPLHEKMPAIALTGYARSEDRLRALMAGFQSHIAKPALPQELLAVVHRLLDSPE